MLFPLLTRVTLDLAGLAPATLFAQVTGVNHLTLRRNGCAAVLGDRAEEIRQHRLDWIRHQLKARGATDTEVEEMLFALPESPVAQMVYSLGLLDDHASSLIRTVVERLDNADARLSRLIDLQDEGLVFKELGPDSPLGAHYCVPLEVAGIGPCRARDDEPTEDGIRHAAICRRAHMALSLLAAMDHELGNWSVRHIKVDHWSGRSRFAALLVEPQAATGQRQAPADPIARLVDLVGAVGEALRCGRWPEGPPTILKMGRQAEISHAVSGDGARFIRNLRSGKTRMTGSAFRQLVRSQCLESIAQSKHDLDTPADLLSPYLFAAHLFTHLIPSAQDKEHHLDRTGWRSAYMVWWQRYAGTAGRPAGAATYRPPPWLLQN